MSNLAERLRTLAQSDDMVGMRMFPDRHMLVYAADRIVALEAEVERLREVLELIANRGAVFDAKGTHSKWVCDIARAALAGEDDEK